MSREKVYLRVIHGGFAPADSYALSVLRSRGFRTGDVIKADLTKPRNPKFNRLVHRIGQLVVANLDDFAGMDAHTAIKRLQIESGTACDEIGVSLATAWGQIVDQILAIPGVASIESAFRVVGSLLPKSAIFMVKTPRSLSFESMDEGEYHEVARSICRYLSEKYWPTASPEAIEKMADAMIQEAV